MADQDWLPAAVRAAGIDRRLKAGQALFRLGDRTRGLHQVMHGRVRLVRVDQAGREAVLHVAAAGDTIAEASLFSPTYHCDAIAASDAVVRAYPKAVILAALERDPKIARAFMAMLARQIMSLRTRLESGTFTRRAIASGTILPSMSVPTERRSRSPGPSRILRSSWDLPTRPCTGRLRTWRWKARSSGSKARSGGG